MGEDAALKGTIMAKWTTGEKVGLGVGLATVFGIGVVALSGKKSSDSSSGSGSGGGGGKGQDGQSGSGGKGSGGAGGKGTRLRAPGSKTIQQKGSGDSGGKGSAVAVLDPNGGGFFFPGFQVKNKDGTTEPGPDPYCGVVIHEDQCPKDSAVQPVVHIAIGDTGAVPQLYHCLHPGDSPKCDVDITIHDGYTTGAIVTDPKTECASGIGGSVDAGGAGGNGLMHYECTDPRVALDPAQFGGPQQKVDTNTKVNTKNCPPGTFRDMNQKSPTVGQCLKDPCPAGSHWSNYDNKCVPE